VHSAVCGHSGVECTAIAEQTVLYCK